MSELHIEHMREHLARVRDGFIAVKDAETVFLGADDGEVFQELVGFRLEGMATPVLAALPFQSHGLPGIPYARESLASYLENPPRPPLKGPFGAPRGRIVALMPRSHESIPDFLKGLRAGRSVPSMVLDPRRVRLAFDFRSHSPSAMDVVKQRSGPLRTYALRTVDGHVLTGRSSAIADGGGHRLIAFTEAVQFTPRGPLRLPNLMLNTSWVALWMDVTEEATRLAAAHWVPFMAGDANGEIVLGLPARTAARAASPAARRAARPASGQAQVT
ncbi:MAG: hypothetical protein KY453_01640 [Gemmatimonadetes bacterium]|nr:hypothetical protein [Gemmatimonadota bacterium]